MNQNTRSINKSHEAQALQHPQDRFDHWAGRVIDVLAGVGLMATLALVSALSGYIWGLLQ